MLELRSRAANKLRLYVIKAWSCCGLYTVCYYVLKGAPVCSQYRPTSHREQRVIST